ncbi:vig2 [Cochliomyia hominivorax]
MDISGNNRYELLFMDDDTGATSAQVESASKRKTNTASKKSTTALNVKKAQNVEKENKSGTLNKNNSVKKSNAGKSKPAGPGTTLNKNRIIEGERKVAFKSQNNEVREQRNNRRNFREGVEFGNEQREARQFRDRDNRGTPRNRDGTYRGKREFDRQSGSDKTGVKAIDKRDGAGAHNWGSVKQEIDDINKSETDADATLTDKDESSNEQTTEQPAVPEEVKELTLDEWKALRGERTKPQYNIRKPNEGEDTSEWKKMVVLNKKKEGDSEEEYEYDPSMYPQRVGRLQRIVDIQFNFNDGRRGGGFGRGRGRGPRPGGDNKGSRSDGDRQPRQRNFGERQQKRSTANALKVDDERQFPTLS